MRKLDSIDRPYENCLSREEVILFIENKYEHDKYARIIYHIDKCKYCAEAVSGIKLLSDPHSIFVLPALWQSPASTSLLNKSFRSLLVTTYVILFSLLFYLLKPPADHNKIREKNRTKSSGEYPSFQEPPLQLYENLVKNEPAPDNMPSKGQNNLVVYEKLLPREAFLLSQKENILNTPVLKSSPKKNIIYLENLKIIITPVLALSKDEWDIDKNHVPAQYESIKKIKNGETFLSTEENYNSTIIPALKKFNNAEYLSCISLFNGVLKKYPGDINCRFYLAVTYKKINQPEIAEHMLTQLSMNTACGFDEEIEWHLALTKFSLNKINEARVLLEKITRDGGFYAGTAKQKVETLNLNQ